jgi:hypothetical protein
VRVLIERCKEEGLRIWRNYFPRSPSFHLLYITCVLVLLKFGEALTFVAAAGASLLDIHASHPIGMLVQLVQGVNDPNINSSSLLQQRLAMDMQPR